MEIPGGELWLKIEEPQVPIYPVVVSVPQGYRVQDVQMTYRSAPSVTQGLSLTVNVAYTDTLDSAQVAAARAALQERLASPDGSGEDGWFPTADFDWSVMPNNDGSSNLNLTLFPFFYNPLTTDVRFHQNYTFSIRYTTPGISLTWFTTDRTVYAPGELVNVDIGLASAAPTDVVVEASVHHAVSDEVVDGLLLRTLTGLSGEAAFATSWDSRGVAAGDYYMRVTLRDAAGDLLDQATRQIQLGAVSAEVTGLSATPSTFALGEAVGLSMDIKNTGAVELSGAAVIDVRNSSGQIVKHFEHAYTRLQPNATLRFNDTWTASGVAPGVFGVVGEMHYEGAVASRSLSITGTGGATLYLPVIVESHW